MINKKEEYWKDKDNNSYLEASSEQDESYHCTNCGEMMLKCPQCFEPINKHDVVFCSSVPDSTEIHHMCKSCKERLLK